MSGPRTVTVYKRVKEVLQCCPKATAHLAAAGSSSSSSSSTSSSLSSQPGSLLAARAVTRQVDQSLRIIIGSSPKPDKGKARLIDSPNGYYCSSRPSPSQRGLATFAASSPVYDRSSSSSSNLDLHPDPVDSSLFEDPIDEYEEQLEDGQSSSSYEQPSPAMVLERILTRNGSPLTHLPTLDEAYSTLQQLKTLHSDLGPALPCYIDAAFLATPYRGHREVLEWTAMIPEWSRDGELAGACQKLELMLRTIKRRIPKEKFLLEKMMEILLKKGWHADPGMDRVLVGVVKDLYHLKQGRGDVIELWQKMAAFQVDRATSTLDDEAYDQQRLIIAKTYNAAIRHLAIQGRFEEAAKMVFMTDNTPGNLTPTITRFTYRLVLEEFVKSKSPENLFLAQRMQGHIHAVRRDMRADELKQRQRRQQAGESSRVPTHRPKEHPLYWSLGQATYLLETGSEFLDLILAETTFSLTDGDDAEQHQSGQTSSDEVVLLQKLDDSDCSMGQIRDALVRLLKARRHGGKTSTGLALPSAHIIARYQDRLISSSSPDPAHASTQLPSRVPTDAHVQSGLTKVRGGKGLWEFAYMQLLVDRGQHLTALHFFIRNYPTMASDLQSLLEYVRNMALPRGNASGLRSLPSPEQAETALEEGPWIPQLLWPSTHLTPLVMKALTSLLSAVALPSQEDHSVSRQDQGYDRRQAYLKREAENEDKIAGIEQRLSALSNAYDHWKASLFKLLPTKPPSEEAISDDNQEQALAERGTPRFTRRGLQSAAFTPWLRSLCGAEAQVMGVRQDVAERRFTSEGLLSRLEVFRDCSYPSDYVDHHQQNGASLAITLSPASYRSLSLLLDMQTLAVEPSAATYTTVLDTLGRDDASIWPLVVHLATKMGLVPQPSTLTADNIAQSKYSIAAAAAAEEAVTPNQQSSTSTPIPHASRLLFRRDRHIAYTALLRGLLARPLVFGGRASALPEARIVRDWIRQAEAQRQGEMTSLSATNVVADGLRGEQADREDALTETVYEAEESSNGQQGEQDESLEGKRTTSYSPEVVAEDKLMMMLRYVAEIEGEVLDSEQAMSAEGSQAGHDDRQQGR